MSRISADIKLFFVLLIAFVFATLIALPQKISLPVPTMQGVRWQTWERAPFRLGVGRFAWQPNQELKQGLDIQGGTQVVLAAEMADLPAQDRAAALESARQVIQRRVDLFGVSEPVVQTAQSGNDYRIVVELAGVKDTAQALQLVGQTAQLDFRLLDASASAQASESAVLSWDSFISAGLTGKELKRAQLEFDPKTNEPLVGIEFNDVGRERFSKITQENVGQVLAIFLDDSPLMLPRIETPIFDGRAVIKGAFTVEQAKQLGIQLNAGALPVRIRVLEQRTIGASLGQESVTQSVRAGVIGLTLILLFMIFYYGWRGVIASVALLMYAVFTIALYKIWGVTLTLPGIAGMLLTIGMAVDANILIFERMKEELRAGRDFSQAMEQGFGRAWDSIKDANIATIFTALILINPLDFSFLNSSGLVRGFGLTLLIGVILSLFTGMIVTRTLMRVFLAEPKGRS